MKKAIVLLTVVLLLTGCALNLPAPKPENNPPDQPQQTQQSAPAQPTKGFSSSLSNPNVDKVHQLARRFDGRPGLFAKNLRTGQTISYQPDDIFPTASTHKLVVALAVYKYLYADASQEKKKQYDRHIKDMMVISDNPAFYALLREIEKTRPTALTQVLTDLGLVKTRIHSKEAFQQYGYHSVTTPQEMAAVLETIYQETYLGQPYSAILKEELAHTIYLDEIPRKLQQHQVLHKVGSLPGVLCDVGLVDNGKDQILISVYSTTKRSEVYASNFLAEWSEKTVQALRTP